VTRFVVDASVAAKRFFSETHTQAAARLLRENHLFGAHPSTGSGRASPKRRGGWTCITNFAQAWSKTEPGCG